ncbi:MAG TPA: FAD-dependent oxidoreductase [Candidatus Binatia bacterium]|nr:FAD-dependent oxidoreductase [Candidatus Binatia bacterium]
MKRTADVVVIGAGVTGLATAFHLARRRAGRIVVVERWFVGAGGTGHSVGIVRQLYPTVEATQMVRRSLDVFRHFAEAVGGHAGYVACGVLIAVSAAMRPLLEKTLATQRGLGVRAEILPPEDVRRLDPRIDTTDRAAVLWEPDSGYGDPVGVAAGFADAARRLGVTIEQHSEVTAIVTREGRVRGIRLASGEAIETGTVVNAAGLWAPRMARLVGLELPIVIGRHPVFILERGGGFGPPHPVYLDLDGGAYVRPETGNLTLTGSLTDDETQHPMDPEHLGMEPAWEEAEPVLARTMRALPALADARYRRGYAGAFDITPDWMPILDRSPVDGFWIAAGMSGHGFKLSPAVGETMAALITGATPPVSPEPFRLGRFTGTRPAGSFVSSYLSAGPTVLNAGD